MNIEFSLQIVEKYSNTNFRMLSSNKSRDVPRGQTDKRTDMTKLIVAFRSFVNASKNWWLWRRNAQWELHEMAKRKSIQNLPSFSVTVLHNRAQDRPAHTSNSDKKPMQEWLTGGKIPFSANVFTTDPYELMQLKTPYFKWYKGDNLLAKTAISFSVFLSTTQN
jgi:hypothetical protein